ncbi:oligosaccharide flippase family protein [Klebsiella quasipneumoniae]|uniref:oligosaccharide flippase family protein n=1 Tax=Klebsiella quasipneumoniae TaxID=1463165 RepID=UPI0013EF4695|nr:oligosaccharide flippase family protein [Klebsiella quasipneumoniae]
MQNNSILSRLLKDSTWSMISTFANKISFVIVGIIVARILGAEKFAIFAIIQSVVVMLANVFSQSITTATSKHIAEYIEFDKNKAGAGIVATLIFSMLFASTICLCANFFPNEFSIYLLFHEDYLIFVSSTAGIIVLTIGLGWVQGVFSGFRNFKLNAAINLLYAGISVPFAYVLTSKYGISGAFYSVIISQSVTLIISTLFIFFILKKNHVRFIIKSSWRERGVITHVGLPVFLTGIIVAPITWYSNKLLSVLSDGLNQLAVFAASMQWSSIFTQVSVVLGAVLIPMLAANKDKNNELLDRINFYSSWLFTIICTVPLIIFVDLFVRIYGKFNLTSDFKVSVIFVLFSAILTSFKGGVARKIIILNLSWFSVLSNLGWAFIFVALTWKTKKYGAVGITGALFFSQFIHFIITIPYFLKRKIIDISMIFNIHVLTLIFVPMISIYVSFRIDSLILKAIACVVIMVFSVFKSIDLIKIRK